MSEVATHQRAILFLSGGLIFLHRIMKLTTKLITAMYLLAFCSFAKANEFALIESAEIHVNPEFSAQKLAEKSPKIQSAFSKVGAAKLSRIIKEHLNNDLLVSKKKSSSEASVQSNFVRSRGNDYIQVYLTLTSVDEEIIETLQSFGVDIEVINKQFKMVQGWVHMPDLEELASNSFVSEIASPDYSYSKKGAATSQGVNLLKANALAQMGYRGKGVKVGIVSSGANDWRLARDSGDLPEQVTVYGSCTKRSSDSSVTDLCSLFDASCNEGTAMAEIVHDIAPEAEIGIAAVSTSLEFISQIERLINDFKADIIVDDLGFLLEPSFYDGPLASAISEMSENVLFVSSAGNNGYGHYRSNLDYSLDSINLGGIGVDPHDFDPGRGFDPYHGFVIPADSAATVLLKWDGRPKILSSHWAFRLWILNQQGQIIYESPKTIARASDAIAGVCIPNQSSTDTVNFAVVELTAGAGDQPFQLQIFGRGAIEYPYSEGSIFGHPALKRVIATGAISADTFSSNNVNFYSSRGPAIIYKVEDNGFGFDELVLDERRDKPDIVGVDGVSVTGSGGFVSQFFGTSAAAPHIAAIAAQLMSVSGLVRPKDVRAALLGGARDIESTGFDFLSGHGTADAMAAKELLKFVFPLPGVLMLLDEEE